MTSGHPPPPPQATYYPRVDADRTKCPPGYIDIQRHPDGTVDLTAVATQPYVTVEVLLSDTTRRQLIVALGGTP